MDISPAAVVIFRMFWIYSRGLKRVPRWVARIALGLGIAAWLGLARWRA
jgi:hypothetical protein